jgi:DNA-binding XRE family transcriptional regulator
MLIIVCCCQDLLNLHLCIPKLAMKSKANILIFFGNKVKTFRKEKGISQEELAFRSELHRTYIGMIERAEKNVTLKNIEKIANGLGISIQEFFK